MGLTDRVANQLLEMIAARQVRPGDRLPPEREIGEALGVSRTVVREAIRALAGKGVLSINSGRGVIVTQVNTANVAEAMRLFIETRGGYHEEGPFSYEKSTKSGKCLKCGSRRWPQSGRPRKTLKNCEPPFKHSPKPATRQNYLR